MKVAFYTTVYPDCIIFFPRFLNSLKQQDCSHFDLVISNDGIENLEELMTQGWGGSYTELLPGETPAETRFLGLKYIYEQQYDYVVLGDSDDYFPVNRISKSLELLEKYDVIVNDFHLVDFEDKIIVENYLSCRLNSSQAVFLEDIADKNFMGLTNTAFRVSWLRELTLEKSLIAFDWYMYSLFLSREASAVFTTETQTYYRQYGANTASLLDCTLGMLKKGIEVKQTHFCALKKIEVFSGVDEKLTELMSILNNENNATKKLSELQKIKTPLWWEGI